MSRAELAWRAAADWLYGIWVSFFPPAPGRVRRYGGTATVHRTGTVDIQRSPDGEVVRVWFRCLSLPFTVSETDDREVYSPGTVIDEIRYHGTF